MACADYAFYAVGLQLAVRPAAGCRAATPRPSACERRGHSDTDDQQPCSGCIIRAQGQTLEESWPVTGTPYRLHYSSERVFGRSDGRTLTVPLSGTSVPASLQEIELMIRVAGQRFNFTFPPVPNQYHTFVWDGKDGYGRVAMGKQVASIDVVYRYAIHYYAAQADFTQSFAALGEVSNDGAFRLLGQRGSQTIALVRSQEQLLGSFTNTAGLGGLSLDVHHAYDATSQTIHRGDGAQRRAESRSSIATTVVRDNLNFGRYITFSADGTLYISDTNAHQILRVGVDGSPQVIAGIGGPGGFGGDGGPATAARLHFPMGIAFDADGNLYIADQNNHRARKISPDGIITTFAGNGNTTFDGDEGNGGPATDAPVYRPVAVAVGPDGSVYIGNDTRDRVRRVDTSGIITTVAGTDLGLPFQEGAPATQVSVGVDSLALANDGSVYIGDGRRIYKVRPEGTITKIAGHDDNDIMDGVAATDSGISDTRGIAVARDGSLYFTDLRQLRRIGPDGVINTVMGDVDLVFIQEDQDDQPARRTELHFPHGVAIAADGSVHVMDSAHDRVRRLDPAFPAFSTGEVLLASETGGQLFKFSSDGRHLETVDTHNGHTLYRFQYDTAGQLASVSDRYGTVTVIERDPLSGEPQAIVAPDGQRTTLTLDAGGYIDTVSNPANETHSMAYTPGGLLTRYERPKGNVNTFTYDDLGRLQTDQDPAGGGWALDRTPLADGYQVTLTDGENRSRNFSVAALASGDQRLTTAHPDGTVQTKLLRADGEEIITQPDGVAITVREGPDPRFGMQSPIPETTTVQTPSGLTATTTVERVATLSDSDNPLSLTQQTDTITTNGRVTTVDYTSASRTYVITSPEGRTRTTVVDENGRVTSVQIPGINPITYSYDERGRLQTVASASRVTNLAYDSDGYLDKITDPLNRVEDFNYDLAGRISQQTSPDLRTISFGYDANGNLDSVTPPSKPTHNIGYDAVDLQERYSPPAVGAGTTETLYGYNLAQQRTQIDRPDGQSMTLNYDTAGKLDVTTIPRGEIHYDYHHLTGQLNSISTPEGNTLSFIYDGFLLEQEAWGGEVSGTVSRSYDNNFWLRTLNVNGDPIDYDYDNDGLLIQAGALTLTPDPQNGLLRGTTLGGVDTSYNYNAFAEFDGHGAAFNGSVLYDVTYRRDALGRILEKTETIQGATTDYDYDYDLAGRLDTVIRNGVLISDYEYDANGNRTHVNGVQVAQYDKQDRLLSYDNAHFTYTANGELKTKSLGVQDTVYDYDVLGNLATVVLPDGTSIEYIVDGFNRRIGKKVNGLLVQGFIYHGQLNPVGELDGQGNLVSRFVYAHRSNVPSYFVKNGITYRIISDHLGSPRLVIDTATGAVAQQLEYDEFGQVILDTNPGFQPFGFAGGLFDIHTKLVRLGQRDYDADIGRWIVKDPIRFDGDGTNLYAYVSNDPINFIDILGLSKFDSFYGLPKKFWNWFHRHPDMRDLKGPDGQVDKDTAEDFYREWIELGKPKPDSKGKNRQKGVADPSVLELLIPWPITPVEIGCAELDCDGNGVPDELERDPC